MFDQQQAQAFHDARLWEPMTAVERARFQLGQERLCMPFDVYHDALAAALGRAVWVTEMTDPARLLAELDATSPA